MNKYGHFIRYDLVLEDGQFYQHEVDLERPTHGVSLNNGKHPPWTRLVNQQCTNCPLAADKHHYCPTAVDIAPVAEQFIHHQSIDRVDVTVHTPERSFHKNCDLQTALCALFGLMMASSECPLLARLKPLAYFHYPFATLEESVRHIIGNYLIGQYIRTNDDKYQPDWSLQGIEQLFSDLKIVNTGFMARVRTVAKEDASINALLTLLSTSSILEMGGVDRVLQNIAPIVVKFE